ncbi:hypothetical protein [Reyranella sp.]|uniref:hypothetical protein n=1 Tax=Reyranella sp. TaxID=1929291 RepID=UPI0011F63D46|nr:hypothetical protein [Reyranella sp.]TAJ84624.1 MAG: hypothetical protein EPO50_18240 [Reyranella sp.]
MSAMPKTSPLNKTDNRRLWATFSRAIGAELRDLETIKGATGLEHPALAIAVDDKNKRVIIFSAEQNARIAALMQGDVQATMPDVNVLICRPVTVDLGAIVRGFFPPSAEATVNISALMQRLTDFNQMDSESQTKALEIATQTHLRNPLMALAHAPIPALVQLTDVLQQARFLDWNRIITAFKDTVGTPVSLEALRRFDTIEVDRQHGVCAVPLYEFEENDWELFFSGKRIDDAQRRLQELNIYQYFFPSPDQLALGLAEKGVNSPSQIVDIVRDAPAMGHPLGSTELVPATTQLPELLDQLGERGYVLDGEHGVEITEMGRTTRTLIRFRPREGLITKMLNRFNLNANINASLNASVTPKDFV